MDLLPPGILSTIINSLPRSDQAGLRTASAELRRQTNVQLTSFVAAPKRLDALSTLLQDLPALQSISLDMHE
jgi:hypothetical protein